MPLETGQILNNRYRIVKLLGQGGFGAVYRAWDINLERPRALKENLETSPEAQRQFKREAQILCDLEHPNLPRVVDHFVIPGQGQYLVMDYVEGEDLQAKLDQAGGPLPIGQVLPWILQVCEALEYLHSQSPPVIHRDIKPANIRVSTRTSGPEQVAGKARLVDFGIAKVYDAKLKTTLGARAVTPGYSPPEQYGLGATDAQSDIYALGATLYCLLTGREPPASVDIVSGSAASPLPAHQVNSQVPMEIGAAIQKAMQVSRADRFASVSEFRMALTAPRLVPVEVERIGATIQISPTEAVQAVQAGSTAAVSPRRRIGWLAVAGLLAVLIIGAGVSALLRGSGNQPAEVPPIMTSLPALLPTAVQAPVKAFSTATTPPKPTFKPLYFQAPDCDYGGIFKMIHAVDERTVKFILCQPDPAFLAKIANPAFSIQPAEILEDGTKAAALLEKPVGTGPYLLSDWNQDLVKLIPFPEYWGEKARKDLLFFWESDPENRLTKLVEGAVDSIDLPPPDKYPKILSDANLKLLPRASLDILYLGMNNRFPPFNDEKVRQAIAMGIDRQWLIDTYFPGGTETATHFTPCAVDYGCEFDPWYEFNPEMARQLLAEAGFPNGFKTSLIFRNAARPYLLNPRGAAEGIQIQLKENLAIETELVVMESGEFLQQLYAGKLQGPYLMGWIADYPDVTDFLDMHFGEHASVQFGEKSPELIGVLKEAAKIENGETRRGKYAEANKLIRMLVPMVPLAHVGSAAVYNQAVKNPQASPFSTESFNLMDIPGQPHISFVQSSRPDFLYCAQATEADAFRMCSQISEPLYRYKINSTTTEPALAERCEPNEDLSVWHCYLRAGVRFHNGSTLDANDVVMSYAVQWDASQPMHKQLPEAFSMWEYVWGGFINQP
jgi:peptide/nickel transport system substrate-binding protein